jgi:hypothetical protein
LHLRQFAFIETESRNGAMGFNQPAYSTVATKVYIINKRHDAALLTNDKGNWQELASVHQNIKRLMDK